MIWDAQLLEAAVTALIDLDMSRLGRLIVAPNDKTAKPQRSFYQMKMKTSKLLWILIKQLTGSHFNQLLLYKNI